MKNNHKYKPKRDPLWKRAKDFRVKDLKLSRDENSHLYLVRKELSILFFIMAVLQFIPTVTLPLNPYYDGFTVYSRNITSICVLILFGFYLILWGNKNKTHDHKQMTFFIFFTLAVSLACLFKAMLTTYYFFRLNMDFNLGGFYYFGELILWTVMGAYFLYYFIILIKRRNKNQKEHQKTVSDGK